VPCSFLKPTDPIVRFPHSCDLTVAQMRIALVLALALALFASAFAQTVSTGADATVVTMTSAPNANALSPDSIGTALTPVNGSVTTTAVPGSSDQSPPPLPTVTTNPPMPTTTTATTTTAAGAVSTGAESGSGTGVPSPATSGEQPQSGSPSPSPSPSTSTSLEPSTVSFEFALYSVPSDFPYVWLNVVRSGGLRGNTSVLWTTGDGTAVSGVDYRGTAHAQAVVWADGQGGAQQIFIPLIPRQVGPFNRAFSVILHPNAAAAQTMIVPPNVSTVVIGQPSPFALDSSSSTGAGGGGPIDPTATDPSAASASSSSTGASSGEGGQSPQGSGGQTSGGGGNNPISVSPGQGGGGNGGGSPAPSGGGTGGTTNPAAGSGSGGSGAGTGTGASGGTAPSSTGGSGSDGSLLDDFASAFVWDAASYQTDNGNRFVVVSIVRVNVFPLAPPKTAAVSYETVDGTVRQHTHAHAHTLTAPPLALRQPAMLPAVCVRARGCGCSRRDRRWRGRITVRLPGL
jgi:hypothetical protein